MHTQQGEVSDICPDVHHSESKQKLPSKRSPVGAACRDEKEKTAWDVDSHGSVDEFHRFHRWRG